MVDNKNIRSYEVSIWTLQDSFITVLKPLNLEYKGLIQDGKITLQDDGENRISFSIPMYITKNGEFVENPLWYSKKEGYLIANLRKLKVIFNKKTEDEMVFEFLITKVTESHEGFEKKCSIEGEGLAFNELGKQGYKISLSADDLYAEINDKLDELDDTVSSDSFILINEISVKNNINYWVDKVLEGTNWKYSVQMDWSIVDGIANEAYRIYGTTYENLSDEQRTELNNNRANAGLRRYDCVYEDTYVSSWDIVNNSLIPTATIDMMEKLRVIDSSDSNRYNLIQIIAETFEVYTKFKYHYDDNYHIIGREIIFYNNFLNESNFIDLNYSYETQSVSRELDAVDVVTKMYVKSLDDETYPSGSASIADTEANKTREDYLLNFDYLYSIKTISDEQYAAIKEFENKIAALNNSIIILDNEIISLNKQILDAEIARDHAKLMAKEAQENITYINDQIEQLQDAYKDANGNPKEEWEITTLNPAFVYVSKELGNSKNYIGKFGSQYSGIKGNSIIVYSNKNNQANSKVKFSKIISDENIILNFGQITPPESGYFYATFKYNPALKNQKLREKYETLYKTNFDKYNKKANEIGRDLDDNGKEIKVGTGNGLKDTLETKEKDRKSLYNQKKALISKFENLMGPALREGNWQPEDEYSNYGDQYDETIVPSYTIGSIDDTKKLNFIWDKELFDEEEKNYYESGINQDKVYYPCIDLSKINSNFINKLKVEELRNQLTLVYKVNNNSDPYLFPQGTSCRFAFIQKTDTNNNVIPVLMLTNLDYGVNVPEDITNAYLSFDAVDALFNNNGITVDNDKIFSVSSNAWVTNLNLYDTIYPRLQFDFENLKIGSGELFLNIYREKTRAGIKYYDYIEKLEEFADYYIMSREGKKYITIKPETLIASKVGESKIKINYSVSNTALQIYLDAIKVMKENAYPKVSYTVSNILSKKLMYDTYNRLGQLAHINDAELKFQNVMGYISAVELNLDKPWEDTITIKNYKTKFEDLFSTIVAQTEEMKKNAARLNVAANAFSPNGMLIAPFTQDSLLNSPQVVNNIIRNNASIIATRAVTQAASDKAALAMTRVYSVMNGNTGIAFTGNNINSVALNQDDGLVIAGKTKYKIGNTNVSKSIFFKLDNANMGFFEGSVGDYSKPLLYFDNGDLALSGTVYAGHGWFGGERGWIIGNGVGGTINYKDTNKNNQSATITNRDLGGLLYSANGKAIFTSGTDNSSPMIILSKSGFPNVSNFNPTSSDAVFLFDGNNLYISGTISAVAGNIGGWVIGDNYIGNQTDRNSSTVGMSSKNNTYSFWAGGAYNDGTGSNVPKFSVSPTGYLYSTSGKIANWVIDSDSIYFGTKENNDSIRLSTVNFSRSINNNNLTTLRLAFGQNFGVTNTGKLYAHEATITGTLTAGAGSKIGSWIISSNHIGNNSSRDNSSVAMSYWTGIANDNLVFWAGGYPNTNNGHTAEQLAKFRVTYGGKLYATGAEISGAITAITLTVGATSSNNYLTYDSTNGLKVKGNITATSGSFTGTITANKGQIGQLRISQNQLYYAEQNKFIGIFPNRNDYVFAIGGKLTSIDTSTGDISFSDLVFKVTGAGQLYATGVDISGKITAGAGSNIGGWTIGSSTIGNGIDAATSSIGLLDPSQSNDNRPVFWAGGARITDNIVSGNTDLGQIAPFRVTKKGKLYADGAIISGSTNITIDSGNFKIQSATSNSYLQFKGIDLNSEPDTDGGQFRMRLNGTWSNKTYNSYFTMRPDYIGFSNGHAKLYLQNEGGGEFYAYGDVIHLGNNDGNNLEIWPSEKRITLNTTWFECLADGLFITDSYKNKYRIIIQSSTPTTTQLNNAFAHDANRIIWIDLPNTDSMDWQTCSVKYRVVNLENSGVEPVG